MIFKPLFTIKLNLFFIDFNSWSGLLYRELQNSNASPLFSQISSTEKFLPVM
jgi:hypothetical protein